MCLCFPGFLKYETRHPYPAQLKHPLVPFPLSCLSSIFPIRPRAPLQQVPPLLSLLSSRLQATLPSPARGLRVWTTCQSPSKVIRPVPPYHTSTCIGRSLRLPNSAGERAPTTRTYARLRSACSCLCAFSRLHSPAQLAGCRRVSAPPPRRSRFTCQSAASSEEAKKQSSTAHPTAGHSGLPPRGASPPHAAGERAHGYTNLRPTHDQVNAAIRIRCTGGMIENNVRYHGQLR
ncbi:hypothetical protein LshimejAT787_1602670 [Lyophyllum shimeji]|uniref:Uncharacterized protein n=1 Tax=Lyophyllum shimeji TaxID=47721 RepID=A0A9P3UTM4_LYOSH|nr:hypothetical protein LshimejAT787_1602670 [Lyophyllum shimeji]